MNTSFNRYSVYLIIIFLKCLCSCSGTENDIVGNQKDLSKIVLVDGNLQSDMVIQQRSTFKISGKGTPNQNILVHCSWEIETYNDTTTVLTDGTWTQIITIPNGSYTNRTITVKGKNTELTFSNILIGEVWLCAGQSNMWFPVKNLENANDVKVDAENYSNIRLLQIKQVQSDYQKEEIPGKWQICSASNIEWFSAVGYFFSVKLLTELNVPIGIINASWGDTTAEVWVDRACVLANPLIAERALRNDGIPRYDASIAYKIGSAYNAMIYPLRNIPIAGIIWYQGESNMDYVDYYPDLIFTLADNWRKLWNSSADEVPFYISQICPYKRTFNFLTNYANPALRFAQTEASEKIPNSGLICNDDIADINDVHPKNKQDVGIRFAYLALSEKYGLSEFRNKKSPILDKVTLEGNSILLDFKYAENGLKTRDDKAPTLFEITGAEKVFYPAIATIINNNQVRIISSSVPYPVAARLGWSYIKTTNLISDFGLPVSVFKTYNWKDSTEEFVTNYVHFFTK